MYAPGIRYGDCSPDSTPYGAGAVRVAILQSISYNELVCCIGCVRLACHKCIRLLTPPNKDKSITFFWKSHWLLPQGVHCVRSLLRSEVDGGIALLVEEALDVVDGGELGVGEVGITDGCASVGLDGIEELVVSVGGAHVPAAVHSWPKATRMNLNR